MLIGTRANSTIEVNTGSDAGHGCGWDHHGGTLAGKGQCSGLNPFSHFDQQFAHASGVEVDVQVNKATEERTGAVQHVPTKHFSSKDGHATPPIDAEPAPAIQPIG